MQSSDNCYLQRIEPWNLTAWEVCAPMIQAAIDSGDEPYQLEDIKKEIDKNQMQLWSIMSNNDKILAAFVTTIAYKDRVLLIFFAGGEEMEKWLSLIDELTRWGKDNGCTSCQVHGRVGWDRMLKPFGFHKKKIVVEKKL